MFSPLQKPRLITGILITLLSYLFFATASALVKITNGNLPTVEIVFFQNLISLLCIIPYCLKKHTLRWDKSNLKVHLIRDFAGVLSYLFYFFAIKKISLVEATLLAYTAPFFVPIIWKIWMKEKGSNSIWWVIVLGFIGIALILNPSNGIFKIGALYGILAGMISAFSLVSIRILNQRHESLSKTLFYFFPDFCQISN